MKRLDRVLQLILASIAVAGLFYSKAALADTTFDRENIGPFVVETETYDATDRPILHAPLRWTKTRLIWRSADDFLEISLVDDGRIVELEQRLFTEGRSGWVCARTFRPVGAVGPIPSNERFWQWASNDLENMRPNCEWLNEGVRYSAEMMSILSQYPIAADAWKQASIIAFGNITIRCTKLSDDNPSPRFAAYGPTCIEFSEAR